MMQRHPANGFIAIDRKIFQHPIFRRSPDRLVAWEWLIASAAWKPEGRRGDHGVVHVERAQLAASIRDLAKAWGWPKSNVDRFLKRLQREGMVKLKKTGTATGTATGTRLTHPITIITICKYEDYQASAKAQIQKPGQQPGQQPGQAIQEVLPLQGLPRLQQVNNRTKEKEEKVDLKNVGKGQASGRSKPRHGAKGRGMVWWDHGTFEWKAYAQDFKDVRGADKFPESREGGLGNWFKINGEAGLPTPRRFG